MRTSSTIASRTCALLAALAVAACGSPTDAAPGIEPQIVNNTDAFSYQLTSIDHATGTWSYAWENTGDAARVSHASDAGGSGSATLTVRDAAGAMVYSGAFATSGEITSAPAGVPGTWTVEVAYSNYTNTQVNFSVVKQ